MDSIKWKCKNWIAYFKIIWQFSPHPFNFSKVGRVQLSFNFLLLLSIISHSLARFEHVFLKIYIKSGNIIEKKNKTLKYFNIS